MGQRAINIRINNGVIIRATLQVNFVRKREWYLTKSGRTACIARLLASEPRKPQNSLALLQLWFRTRSAQFVIWHLIVLICLLGLYHYFSISIIRLYHLFGFTRMSLLDRCSCILFSVAVCAFMCCIWCFLRSKNFSWKWEHGQHTNPVQISQHAK